MPNCPICQAEGSAFGSEYKCINNHVWHTCSEHNTEVVSSLIGESHSLPNGCSCGMNCLSPKEMQKNPIPYEIEKEEKIKLIPNTTHFNDKILANVEAVNKQIRKEMAKQNVLFAAPIFRPKRYRNTKTNKIEKEVKLPSLKNMPNYISEKGKTIWKEFFNKYHEKWEKYDDPKRQWSTCVGIWRNFAPKHGAPPFAEGQVDNSTNEYMVKRITDGLKKAFDTTKMITKYVISKGFGSKILVLSLRDIRLKDDKWKVTLGQEIKKCVPFKDKNFKDFLGKHSFKKIKGFYKREVVSGCSVVLREEEGKAFMYVQFEIPIHTIQMVLGLTEQDLNNEQKVKRKISGLFKKTLKDVRANG